MRYLGPSRVAGVGMHVSRVDDRTLVIRPEGGFYGKGRFERASRFAVGDRLEFPGMTVEIRDVERGGLPLEAAFVFDVPLEDESLVWLERRGRVFESFRPPAIGETLVANEN